MIPMQCDKCKKEYLTQASWVKKHKNHYCSKECKNSHHSELYGSGITKKEYWAKYAKEHKEQRNAKERERYARVFSKAEYDAAYRDKNKEKLIAKARAKYQKNKHSKHNIVQAAKARAKKQNVPFDLTVNDFEIPSLCPVLGIELKFNDGRMADNSPSLDKIIPSLGYVKGNIAVISARANWIKRDASLSEVRMLYKWLKSVTKEPSLEEA